jgi:hypothetical protein
MLKSMEIHRLDRVNFIMIRAIKVFTVIKKITLLHLQVEILFSGMNKVKILYNNLVIFKDQLAFLSAKSLKTCFNISLLLQGTLSCQTELNLLLDQKIYLQKLKKKRSFIRN